MATKTSPQTTWKGKKRKGKTALGALRRRKIYPSKGGSPYSRISLGRR